MQYSAQQVIEIIDNWDAPTKAFFFRQLAINLTISIRVMGEDTSMSDPDKLDQIKWLNEFHHKMLSWFTAFPGGIAEEQRAGKLMALMKNHADKMKKRGALEFPLASAFETTKSKLAGEKN